MTMLTSEWARTHGRRFTWRCALDNHMHTRNYASGHGFLYERIDESRDEGVLLFDALGTLKDATAAIYIIDNGMTTNVLYTAGHNDRAEDESEHCIYLQYLPTNFDGLTGERKVRADNGRPVDFSSWMMGPRRAYHLKVTMDGGNPE